MYLLIALFVFLVPSFTHAAYQNPVVTDNTRLENGAAKLTFRFSGNAGEPDVIRVYAVGPSTTATMLRNWVHATKAELDLMYTAFTLPALQSGQTVPGLAPTPQAPTAQEVWRRKLSMYLRVKDSGLAGSIPAALAAMKADLEATYQAGFLDAD